MLKHLSLFFAVLLFSFTAQSAVFAGNGSGWNKWDLSIQANMYDLGINNINQIPFQQEIVPLNYKGVGISLHITPFKEIEALKVDIGFSLGYLRDGKNFSVSACTPDQCVNGKTDLDFSITTLNTHVAIPIGNTNVRIVSKLGIGYMELNGSAIYTVYTDTGPPISSASDSINGKTIVIPVGLALGYQQPGSKLSAILEYMTFIAPKNEKNVGVVTVGLRYTL